MKVWAATLLNSGTVYVVPTANSAHVCKRLGVSPEAFVYCDRIEYTRRNGEMAHVPFLCVHFDDGTQVTGDASAFFVFQELEADRG